MITWEKIAIAFLITSTVCFYVWHTPNCENVMNTYLAGMFGIATGYAIAKGEAHENKTPKQ